VSRSYLHLNRGLTSPLATAMNFIPISYFWSPLCYAGARRTLSLSIIPGWRLYATSGLYSELLRHPAWKNEEEKCLTNLRPFLSSRVHEFPSPSPASLPASLLAAPSASSLRRKQEFRKHPRGREIREGCASRRPDLLVRKYRTRRSLLLLYLGIPRLNIASRNLAGRAKHTAGHSPHFQFLPRLILTALSIVAPTTFHDPKRRNLRRQIAREIWSKPLMKIRRHCTSDMTLPSLIYSNSIFLAFRPDI